jgi:hypothetical protein
MHTGNLGDIQNRRFGGAETVLVSAQLLQLIQLLLHFMHLVLAVDKYFAIHGFKIIDITELDTAEPVLLISQDDQGFCLQLIYDFRDLFIDFMAPDADLLFLLPADLLDGNFDKITYNSSDSISAACFILMIRERSDGYKGKDTQKAVLRFDRSDSLV